MYALRSKKYYKCLVHKAMHYNYGIQGLQERLKLKVPESPNSSEGFAMQLISQSCVPRYELPRSMVGTSCHAYSLHYNYRNSHNHHLEIKIILLPSTVDQMRSEDLVRTRMHTL